MASNQPPCVSTSACTEKVTEHRRPEQQRTHSGKAELAFAVLEHPVHVLMLVAGSQQESGDRSVDLGDQMSTVRGVLVGDMPLPNEAVPEPGKEPVAQERDLKAGRLRRVGDICGTHPGACARAYHL